MSPKPWRGRLVGAQTCALAGASAFLDALAGDGLSGAGEGDINEPILMTVRARLIWLVVNLGTAMLAASVVGLFEGTIARFASAMVMPRNSRQRLLLHHRPASMPTIEGGWWSIGDEGRSSLRRRSARSTCETTIALLPPDGEPPTISAGSRR